MTQADHHDQDSRPLVCIVLGQTASGKSSLCLEIAERIEGEIISMDAMKVYKGMDIGTAKTPAAERRNIPHHLIDLVEPQENFNVFLYLQKLEATLKDVLSRGQLPVIDCGTALYLQTFLSGIIDGPEPDKKLEEKLEQQDSESLYAKLQDMDPLSAKELHPNDRKRVIRALAFHLQSGRSIRQLHTHFKNIRDDYRFFITAPLWPSEMLRERIDNRVDAMIQAGLKKEVQNILETGGYSRSARAAIGYQQVLQHLEGEYDFEEAVQKIKQKTWQLSRKQLNWFKKFTLIKWLELKQEEDLKRAAVFLCGELIGLMRASAHGLPIALNKEKRTQLPTRNENNKD